METKLSITRFVKPVYGQYAVDCVICGIRSVTGHTQGIFSDNFTMFSSLNPGNGLCEYCYAFFKNQAFRKRSWVATGDSVIFLSAKESRKYIIEPPPPPFFIYVTSTGKRMGWLRAMDCVNMNRRSFFVSTDFAGTVQMDIETVKEIDRKITILRNINISKRVLKTGNFSLSDVRRIISEGGYEMYDYVRRHIKNQIWEVMLYVNE